ncbi:centrosomal protein of 85 kDa [Biomphalaria pfeifferi]|uniref:Centrosomal protein of 85 kDa n=1 Tax=Biomphalaria pfeifferi TaxID=112525 RepID=A0AAD8BFB8_BIOPF|nr:centrosomal protein of 85 kDa [Biomphalaria pfeifferi]
MSNKLNNKELTNVPDYQKLSSAAAAVGNPEVQLAGWDADVEMLVPSPIIHPPGSQQYYLAENSLSYGRVSPGVSEHKKGSGKIKMFPRASLDSQQHGFVKRNSTLPSKYVYPVYANESKYIRTNQMAKRSFYIDGFSSQREIPSPTLNQKQHDKLQYQQDLDHYKDSQGYSQDNSEYSGHFISEHWNEGGPMSSTNKSSQGDLRAWQQQHQEELIHQHLEADALYQSPSTQPQISHLESGLNKVSMDERWDPVRRAADSIIREKNMIIEKLKNRIFQLEEDCNLSESKLRQSLLSKDDSTDILKQKLQELQHKNTSLKEQLSEERTKKHSEIDDLEVKLGGTEYELKQLKSSLSKKEESISEIMDQLSKKTEEAKNWKEKFNECCNSHLEMKKKLDSIQRYFEELPTLEESKQQAEELVSFKEEVKNWKSRNEDLEKKNSHMRRVITARDFRIHELEEKNKDLQAEIETAHQHLEALGYTKAEQELRQALTDKEKLASDLDKAKKLLETTLSKLKNVEMKHIAEIRTCQEKHTQEEEMVMTLKTEVANKEEQIEKMKKTIKELGSQNQDFLQQSLMFKEELRSLESHNSTANKELQQNIMIQLSYCFSELRALVQICTQRLRGQDPDISLLLGLEDSVKQDQSSGAGVRGTDTRAGSKSLPLSQWLSTIKEMRKEMTTIRTHICNKYAEDMGDNMTCATQ